MPTEAAWALGRKSAELLVTRHLQDHGEWLRAAGLTCWGTANMRTGGDDIAQGFALIGAKPTWDRASGRVTGFEILPPAVLGRPRVDVTLRVSGFFRDAFPDQIALFDRACRAVGALEEDEGDKPDRRRMGREARALEREGLEPGEAAAAGYRVFGSKPVPTAQASRHSSTRAAGRRAATSRSPFSSGAPMPTARMRRARPSASPSRRGLG